VAARTLHPAGCVQFGEEANNHGQSLPSAAPNGKSRSIMVSETRDSNVELRVGWVACVVTVFLKFQSPRGSEGLRSGSAGAALEGFFSG
jgi:hypothetical protein